LNRILSPIGCEQPSQMMSGCFPHVGFAFALLAVLPPPLVEMQIQHGENILTSFVMAVRNQSEIKYDSNA